MNIKELENKCLKPILYSVYGNDLCGDTSQDLLSNMVAYINEVIGQTNDNTKLVQGLYDYVKNQGLSEEVAKQIQIMIDNGTFDRIINQEVFGDLDSRVSVCEEGVKNNTTSIGDINKKVLEHQSRIERINYSNVYSEEDIQNAIINKVQGIEFKNNITINKPIDLDQLNFVVNLNGFTLKISDDYTEDHVFRIGKTEFTTFYDKYLKWIKNGVIDLNDKECYVLNHSFSWSLNCLDLRCINMKKGFIKYTVSSNQNTRGAEGLFCNISLVGSNNIGRETLGFDLWIGDSIYTKLYTQYFTYGIRVRTGGSLVSDCHVWGLPNTGGDVNKIMKIGFINEAYFNRFVDCISDTPERYDMNQPSSPINGGIAFYDHVSSEVRYSSCDILEHPTSTANNSVIGFYFNKPETVDDLYYGQSVYINNCYSRTPSKMANGIRFEGKTRVLNIQSSNLAVGQRGRIRGYNQLPSNGTVFKNDKGFTSDGINDFTLCKEANQYQVINDDYGLKILVRDSENIGKWIALFESPNNPYSKSELQEFAEKLKPMSDDSKLNLYTNNITVILYNSLIEEGQVGRYDQVWWNRAKKQFYNFRTGEFITN